MENLESCVLDVVSSIIEISKKREIRLADLNGLVRKAEDLRGSFTFSKKLMNELSHEGTESVEKLRTVEAELENEKQSHQNSIEQYEEIVAQLNEDIEKKNNLINELTNEKSEIENKMTELNKELSNTKEAGNVLREELNKAYLTCTTYEEQIIRLNEQLSAEALEKQNKGDIFEKKMKDMEEKMETMEEGMYDPEAYYCLERDRV